MMVSHFFGSLSLGPVVWLRLGHLILSESTRDVRVSHLPGRVCVVLIPLVRMAKFPFPEQFPENHLPHAVMSCLMLILHNFSTFVSYLIEL